MDPATIFSSAVVAAIVSGVLSYLRERQILDRKADIDYRSNARKRLYEAIGPLRLQLLLAARDVVDRVTGHLADAGPSDPHWNMNVRGYYVQSFVYRLLRPLAIGQIIQRQMSIADFAVDRGALDLLRFDQAAGRMLAGDEIILKHRAADWSLQTDHLFRDNLRRAAASLVVMGPGQDTRVAEFDEFADRLGGESAPPPLKDFLSIFGRCERSLLENPIFWLRLVGYAYACNSLIASQGSDLGFRDRPYNSIEMLRHTHDTSIKEKPAKYAAAFDLVVHQGL